MLTKNHYEISRIKSSDKVRELIEELNSSKYWGWLEIKFEDGVVVHCKKTENIKL